MVQDFSRESNVIHMAERMLPQNLEAECEILGGCLMDPNAIERIVETLVPEAFYLSAHREIYRCMLVLYNASLPTDLMQVYSWLSDRDLLEKIGGQLKLAQLLDASVSAVNVDQYAVLVMDKWQRRRLIQVGNEIAALGADTETAIALLNDQAEQKLFGTTQNSTTKTLFKAEEIIIPVYEEIESRSQSLIMPGISCGFYDLDAMTQGFQKADLIIVAGRPSMGKTSFVMNIASNVAAFHKLPIAIFSLEMSKEQLVHRMLAAEARIESGRLKAGRVAVNEWETLGHGVAKIAGLPLYVGDLPAVTVSDIRAGSRRAQADAGGQLGLIVIDYLQLMEGGSDNRNLELSKITRSLKALARELNTPVVALSQLSRNVESRTNKRPMMSDLRECLTRSAMLTLAQTGERISIADVKPGMSVLAVDKDQRVVPAIVSQHMSKGSKPAFRLTTKTGRSIECTDNHPILTQRGYIELKDLQTSDLVATAFRMPSGSSVPIGESRAKARLLGYLIGNGSLVHGISFCTPSKGVLEDFCQLVEQFFPGASFNTENSTGNCFEVDVAYHYVENHGKPFGSLLRNWIRELGLAGKVSYEKFCPEWVFQLGEKGSAEFLAGLFYTDGCVKQGKDGRWEIHFDTSSPVLAVDVLQLLARMGVAGTMSKSKVKKPHHHEMYRISLSQENGNLIRFAGAIPKIGRKGRLVESMIAQLFDCSSLNSGTSIFALPKEVSSLLRQKTLHLRHQGIAKAPGTLGAWRDQGKRLNREGCDRYADILHDDELGMWASSDLLWEDILNIEPIGNHETYDICVPQTGNFLANGVAVHNSGAIEQDADLIMMLYRDSYYNPDSPDRGIAEVIITKHRNGPTGTIKLLFEEEFTQFRNMAKGAYRDA